MNILGISAFYHDSAATLVRDGRIVAAAQQERFSRVKHDHRFPAEAIEYCLSEGGIDGGRLDCIAFYDKPFLKFERLLETYLEYAPHGLRSFLMAVPLWLRQKLWIKDLIGRRLGFEGPILFPEHHQSHAAAAFLPSPFPEAAIVTMDGVGEWTTTSYGHGSGNRIELLAEQRFPHSLGLLYSAFTYHAGFKVNSGEYKLMGLAPYGEPRYAGLILDRLVDLKPDGSLRLDMRYFDYCAGLTMTSRHFSALFGGPPRRPESPVTQREMDLAASVQAVTEEAVVRIARHVRHQTGSRRLCLAGGVALNCVANGRLLRERVFDDVWIQPAAGDAGGALGAALYAWHCRMGNGREADGESDRQRGSLLGPAFSDGEISEFLDGRGVPYTELDPGRVAEVAAGLIAEQKVVGWFQGRMEFGPRALGARSILGDARSPGMQSLMNTKIKFRESFRPFAPAVLAERASAWFELDRPSPYMLLVAAVHPDRRRPLPDDAARLHGLELLKLVRSDIPAVTHVDFSARIQTVDRRANPLFHELLVSFERRTGCPVVVNTSFNVRGEPIVCTPDDACRCFLRTGMDALVIGRFLLEKGRQPQSPERDDGWRAEFPLD